MDIVVPDDMQYLYVRNKERPVWKIPDPVLREIARPIEKIDKKVIEFTETMVSAMKLANGIGLAAPQMGKALRIIAIAPGDMKPLVIINPEIMESSEETDIAQEGCLSIPGLYGDVVRSTRVVVEGYDKKGKPVGYEVDGLAARVIQHEVDHLNGVLFIDKAIPETLHWEHPGPVDE
ncbi:MAG: peptide deformylase [Chthonomonas sp.]|nr:peptide deformylase [Chthonomonas sp.]